MPVIDLSWPGRRDTARRGGGRRILAVAAAMLLGAGLAATPATAAAVTSSAAFTFASIPAAGSTTASPETAVSIRGAAGLQASAISVTGTASGAHAGRLTEQPDGRGSTFTPARPFAAGERVHVTATVSGTTTSYSFRVAVPRPHPGLTANGELNTSTGPLVADNRPAVADAVGAPYASRPDLRIPPVTITQPAGAVAPGLVFATPQPTATTDSSVLVYDNTGQPVWFHPVPTKTVGDAKVQTLDGHPVLTWFEGTAPFGAGNYRGEWVVVDSSYREITRLRMSNGYQADLHDMIITPQRTALMIGYNPVLCDGIVITNCRVGGTILDGLIQEVDIATGTVLFEWHALDHLSVADSYVTSDIAVDDYLHENSLDLDSDGNILLSARHTSSLYKIDRSTGALIWVFGGKRNSFSYVNETLTPPGPDFPHDFRARGGGVYSYFDNGVARAGANPPGSSRGAIVRLDASTKQATYLTQLTHNPPIYFATQGDMRQLSTGGNLVAWGGGGRVTEYNSGNSPVWEAQLAAGTYRQVRGTWTGTPTEAPAVAVVARSASSVTVDVSWNGDTQTRSWRIVSGPSPTALTTVGPATPRTGFETTLSGSGVGLYLAVEALDGAGAPIANGRSPVVRGGPWFTESVAPSANYTYQPVVGDFSGSRNADILYYAPGSGADYLHVADGAGGFTSYLLPAITGAYRPLVGDFVGDDRDEVVWWTPGSAVAYMWRFDRAARTAAPVTQSQAMATPTVVTTALVLDNRPAFGGGKDTILWYAAGSAPDRIDSFTWYPAQPLTTISAATPISGNYTPVSGDFDGNGFADVFWYAPGNATDWIWISGSFGTPLGTHASIPTNVIGSYLPRVGNFTGSNAVDELLFYAPGTGLDYLWSFSSGPIVSTDVSNDASGAAYVMRGSQDYVLTWSPGQAPSVWTFGSTASTVTSSGNSALASGYQPLIGDFVGGGGTSSVVWYAPGAAPELRYTPR